MTTMTSAPPIAASPAPSATTWSAPSLRASSGLSGEDVTATVSKPGAALLNWTARWPRPPMPSTATRSCGCGFPARSADHEVYPAHSSGAAAS